MSLRASGGGSRPTFAALAALLAASATMAAPAQQSAADSARALYEQGEHAVETATTVDGVQRGIGTLVSAAAAYGRMGQPGSQATVWLYIGSAYLRLGLADSTIAYGRRALEQYGRGNDPRGEAAALGQLAQAHGAKGRADSALAASFAELAMRRRAGDSTGEARAAYRIADLYRESGRLDSAVAYYRPAIVLFRALRDSASLAAAQLSIGLVFRDLGARDSARAHVAQAVALHRVRADTSDPVGAAPYLQAGAQQYMSRTMEGVRAAIWYWRAAAFIYDVAGAEPDAAATEALIGRTYGALGVLDSAAAAYHSALARQERLRDRAAQGKTLRTLAVLFQLFRMPDSAHVYLRAELALERAMHDSIGMGGVLTAIGELYWSQTAIDSAFAAYRAALAVQRAAGDRAGEGITLNDIGAAQQDLGRVDSAMLYYRLALPLLRDTRQVATEGSTLTNIGGAFQETRQYDSALVYYRAGRERQHAAGDAANEAVTLGNIGSIFAYRGMPDSALAYYREALAIRARNEGVIRSKIAQVFVGRGQRDSALAYYAGALELERGNGDRLNEMITLTDMAMLHQGALTARRDRAPERDLATAVAYFDSASAVASTIAARAGSDANRVVFTEKATLLYENWALSWLGLAGEKGASVAARSSLAVVERGRAQALLQLMRGAPQGLVTGRDLAKEGTELTDWVSQSGVGVLSYYATADTLLVWVVAPNGSAAVMFRDLSRDSLARLVGAWRSALGVEGSAQRQRVATRDVEFEPPTNAMLPGSPAAAAQALAEAILPPGLEQRLRGVTELVIVPHGPLTMVPFAAVPMPSGKRLGEVFALRFAPSLAALREAERRAALPEGAARGRALGRSLVVGNPDMPSVTTVTGRRVKLNALPGAAMEGSWVAQRLGTSELTGPAATETEVRRRLPRATVVHLATHGYAFSSDAMVRESFVALAPGAGNDGLLTVGEILDDPTLRLGAALVVLSACQSGLGDLAHGEGTVGLQRAFLAKGARSVLVSLWNVSDDATAALMRAFYTHWLDDPDHPSKAVALERAQEDVRARPEFRDARYWAAFQIVGAM